MSVATASAVLRVRLTRTISRALPRVTAAIAQAQPTLPVPIIPIFTGLSVASALHAAEGTGSLRYNAGRLEHKPGGALVWRGHEREVGATRPSCLCARPRRPRARSRP